MTDLIEEAEAEAVNLERAGRPKAAALIRRMIAQMRQDAEYVAVERGGRIGKLLPE